MEYINEPSKNIPVSHECDVLVCGGGIAGIAAALASARKGAKVLLLEREFTLGGLATLGLVTIYLPLCDGMGNQIIYGISEELLKLSVKDGFEEHLEEHPTGWLETGDMEHKKEFRYQVQYNPMVFAANAEQLLINEGVQLLYGTVAAATMVEDGRITSVIIENKSGRSAVKCKTCIDCTGDADICYLSGEECAVYPHGNALTGWYYWATQKHGVRLTQLSEPYFELLNPNTDKELHRYSGIDADEITDIMISSRKKTMGDLFKRKAIDDDIAPTTFTTIPQLRMTRRICGKDTAQANDRAYCATSIGVMSNWMARGPVYEIPFGALFGNKIKNLITAGRNISSEDIMWNLTRAIPVCALTGQAAGTAAAMFDDFANADIELLQKTLYEDGVRLHCNEVLTEGE